MTRKPTGQGRRRLLRRFHDADAVLDEVRAALARDAIPPSAAAIVERAAGGLGAQRCRVRTRPTAANLADARRMLDAFGIAVARAIRTARAATIHPRPRPTPAGGR